MYEYKQWLKRATFLIILIVSAFGTFNYKIDSLGVFGATKDLENAAKSLTSGQMVAGLKNYNDRLFQKLVIENLKVKNEVIVLGSSRAMQIRKNYFFGSDVTFFNHSVSGASLEDYIAIIGTYDAIGGYIPKEIIMGVDPWVFNKYNDQSRWHTLSKYYEYEISKIYNQKVKSDAYIDITKWKQLISYEYTILNIKHLIANLNNKKMYYVTDTTEIDDSVKGIDGSIYHPYEKRRPNPEKVKKIAIAYTSGSLYSLEKFHTLSNIKQFEDFVTYLQSKNIKITLFLPPYNPVSYDIFIKNQKYKNVELVEEYLNSFASRNNIGLYGSYNPHKFKLTNAYFSDGMHALDEVYIDILKRKTFEK